MLTDERTNKQISAAIAERLFRWKFYRRQVPITNTYFLAESMPEDRDILAGVAQPFDPNDTDDEYHGYLTLEAYEGSPYASDHNAALGLVVPAMADKGYGFKLNVFLYGVTGATFYAANAREWWVKANSIDELPRAICLAAEAALKQERQAINFGIMMAVHGPGGINEIAMKKALDAES